MFLILALYVLQFAYSFYMMQKTWRYDSDISLGNFLIMCFISCIPVSFVFATLVFLAEYPWKDRYGKPIIVLRKYDKNNLY